VSRNPCAKLHSPERDKTRESVTFVLMQSEVVVQWITLRENSKFLFKYILNARKSQNYAPYLYNTYNSARLTIYNIFRLGNIHKRERKFVKRQTVQRCVADMWRQCCHRRHGIEWGGRMYVGTRDMTKNNCPQRKWQIQGNGLLFGE